MASILKVDDLRGNTAAGNITITSEGGAATQSLQQGLNKAWATFQLGATPAVNNSLNTSSISDFSSGRGALSWTSAMDDADYIMTSAGESVNQSTPYTTTLTDHSAYDRRTTSNLYWLSVYVSSSGGSIFDPTFAHVSINGDLA